MILVFLSYYVLYFNILDEETNKHKGWEDEDLSLKFWWKYIKFF